jgi:hypothetical protein
MFCEHPVALSVERCISSLGQLTRTLNYPAAAAAASFLLNLPLATCFLFFLNILGRCPLCSTFLVSAGCRPTQHKEVTLTLLHSQGITYIATIMRLISRDLRMSLHPPFWLLFRFINTKKAFYQICSLATFYCLVPLYSLPSKLLLGCLM